MGTINYGVIHVGWGLNHGKFYGSHIGTRLEVVRRVQGLVRRPHKIEHGKRVLKHNKTPGQNYRGLILH